MCIEGLKWILARRGLVSPFGVDGGFVLSSDPEPAIDPPTEADFAQLLEDPRTRDEPA
jgi:hypothetical protein